MMNDADRFIENILSHESKYYDPVKAHEYYLRTRELKGKRNKNDLKTDKKKEAWDYVQSELKNAKKNESDAAQQALSDFIEGAKQQALAKREQIKAKLTKLLETLQDREQTATRKAAREKAREEAQQLREELKQTVQTARDNYKKFKEDLTAKYEAEANQEFEAIKRNV
jgi:hypothetical protein